MTTNYNSICLSYHYNPYLSILNAKVTATERIIYLYKKLSTYNLHVNFNNFLFICLFSVFLRKRHFVKKLSKY